MPMVRADCSTSHCRHQRGSEGLKYACHVRIWTVAKAGTSGANWGVAVLHKPLGRAAHACCLVHNACSLTCEARQPNQLTCLSPPGKSWM